MTRTCILSENRGFTLIELMVVVSIISLLSSTILVSLEKARAKARDVKRVTDIVQISNALTLFKYDKGYYPPQDNVLAPPYNSGYNYSLDSTFISTLVSAGYMDIVPLDPRNTGSTEFYWYLNNDGNIGGSPLNETTQGNYVALDCGAFVDRTTIGAVLMFKTESVHDEYTHPSGLPYVNSICFKK